MTYRIVGGPPRSLACRWMRPLLAALALLAAAGAPAAEIRLARVWPEWHRADSFQSYYEYHTGHELTGKWIVLRSQLDDRGGMYFLIRVENPGPVVRGASLFVHVITPDAMEPRVFSFPTDIPAGSQLFETGLTGTDWGGERVEPIAWEIELRAPDGAVLARKTSFLWEKPAR